MRSVQYWEYGSPDVLQVKDTDVPPVPAGAIRIATQAASVNPIDWQVRSGALRDAVALPFPITPGRDAAGVVDEIGPDVVGVSVGDVVFGLGGVQDTYAEQAILTAWTPSPSNWTTAQAASAGLASATALHAIQAVVEAIGPIEGRTVLIEGAAGSVGIATCAFALDQGARVIGTGRPANHAVLDDLGVTPVEYGPGLSQRIAAAAPEGVDAAIDTAASGSLAELVSITGEPKRTVTVADLAGSTRLGVVIVWGENDPEALAAAADLGRAGRYTPRVAQHVDVADVARAHAIAESGAAGGKVVVQF